LTILHLHRFSRGLIAAGLVVSAIAFAGPPVAAATAPTLAAGAVCGTKSIAKHAAPGVGKSVTFAASTAGSVTLVQLTTTTLKVTSAIPASGWKATVITATGTTVHVGFQQVGLDNEQVRFWARLNTTGTRITTILQTCT
jgi:hypothetical protein